MPESLGHFHDSMLASILLQTKTWSHLPYYSQAQASLTLDHFTGVGYHAKCGGCRDGNVFYLWSAMHATLLAIKEILQCQLNEGISNQYVSVSLMNLNLGS